MHLAGLSVTVSSGGRTLLSIPRWDYRYENTYAPVEPIELGPDAAIDCTWAADSRYHTFELGRDGEMCVGSLVLGELP